MRRLQIVLPFFVAGIGTCFAGLLLDRFQHLEVFTKIDELFLVLPALLGLKGNLQMTLASRFSTHSHLGHIQTHDDLLGLTCANLSLNQCFSIVVCLLASILVTVIQQVTVLNSEFDLKHTIIITATVLLTSSITSFLLDILMILVVQAAAHYSLNPDNVATPLAASLGDIIALVLCSQLAGLFYASRNEMAFYWLAVPTIVVYILLIPIWVTITKRNPHTESILTKANHWYPLISAMVISSIGGIILKLAVSKSDDIALFQPVICGVGGNLVAVQASRLATQLHRECQPGELPERGSSACINPLEFVTSDEVHFKVSRLLIAIVVPGQVCFYLLCTTLNSTRYGVSFNFLLMYLAGSQLQVIVLLYLAYVLTFVLWRNRIDPDNCTIPYLTSISDVLGAVIITVICLMVTPTPTTTTTTTTATAATTATTTAATATMATATMTPAPPPQPPPPSAQTTTTAAAAKQVSSPVNQRMIG